MLEVETEARQLIEHAQQDANGIRKKAREDAEKLVIDGRKKLHQRLQQEIAQLEEQANTQKQTILQETERQLAAVEQRAAAHLEQAVERVVTMLVHGKNNPTEH